MNTSIFQTESQLINILKVFLLLQVVIGHILALYLPPISNLNSSDLNQLFLVVIKVLFSFGRESAFAFIVLSGYLTASDFLNVRAKKRFIHLKSLLIKRIVRIYPILIIALIFTFLLDFIGSNLFKLGIYHQNLMNYNFFESFNFLIFIGNLFSLQPTVVNSFGSNGPLWTLGYLIQFYVLYLLLTTLFFQKVRLQILISIIILIMLYFTGMKEFSVLFATWLFGLLCRLYGNSFVDFFRIKSKVFLFSLSLGVVFLFFTAKLSGVLISALIISLAVGLIVYLMKKSTTIMSINSFWGDVFYVVYAIHFPVIFIVMGFYFNYFNFQLGIALMLLLIFVNLIFVALFSFLTMYVYKRFVG